MSTDFLSLALKHLIVYSCGAPCTTTVHDFFRYASGVTWRLVGGAFLVSGCWLVSRPVTVVM